MKIDRHSPSSLNLFCACPSMFVLERIVGIRQPVGAAAFRGTAVEAGVAHGLLNRSVDPQECIDIAKRKFNELAALSSDPRKEKMSNGIEAMVLRGLSELRPYGIPSGLQGFIEWRPDGLRYPIVGYYDFLWADHGIVVDLKTTEALPSAIKLGHARQVAFYAGSDNADARLTYVTPTKSATYRLENIREHREALVNIARKVEAFLALSDDPEFFLSITAPDCESFYWASPDSRRVAFEKWGI